MKKTETTVRMEDFPTQVRGYMADAKVYDSSCSREMQVLYSDRGYYVKIAGKGQLATEAEMARLFAARGLGPQVEMYLSQERDYMVTRSAAGEDALHFLNEPEKLCAVLAQAMRFLHGCDTGGMPTSSCMAVYEERGLAGRLHGDVLIHGDFCLPNVMLQDGKVTAFIDVAQAGLGDRHIDLYWVLWSLHFNLGTDQYTDCFLDHYGRELVDMDRLRLVAEVEEQA